MKAENFFGIQAFATGSKSNDNTEWNLAKKVDGISLYYRWITEGDSIRTREMKTEFTIDAKIPEILSHFRNAESYKSWAVGIKKCNIEKTSDSVWITHTIMNYPWPFKQKDLVTHHSLEYNDLNAFIEIEAAPELLSELEGIERLMSYRGTWHFSTDENGMTRVDCRVVSFTKPMFPRFIQDPVIQKVLIGSFVDLKRLCEK